MVHAISGKRTRGARAGGKKDDGGLRTEGRRGHPFTVRRDGQSVTIAQANGWRAVGFAQIDTVGGAATLAGFSEECAFAVGREISQSGKVKPGQIALAFTGRASADDALARSVAAKENAAVAIDVMQSEHARDTRDQAGVARKIYGIEIATEANGGAGTPDLLAVGG